MFFSLLLITALSAEINFNKDGKLKIAQLTDMHLDLSSESYRNGTARALQQLQDVIERENPDLLVFTGDVVTGEPAEEAWRRLLTMVDFFGLPYVVVLGNHDAEQDLKRTEIADIVMSYPRNLNTLNEDGELADMVLEVKGKKSKTLLYLMDSHDYSLLPDIDGYGWFSKEQVQWYRDISAKYTKENKGKPLPAMAFFHIPLLEYKEAWFEEGSHKGRRAEEECPGAVNTGMFSAFVESGDVFAVWVGHDHDNEYVVPHRGISLGYGRMSGDETTYTNLRPGVRLIVLTEGKRSYESWVHERDGRIINKFEYKDGKIQSFRGEPAEKQLKIRNKRN